MLNILESPMWILFLEVSFSAPHILYCLFKMAENRPGKYFIWIFHFNLNVFYFKVFLCFNFMVTFIGLYGKNNHKIANRLYFCVTLFSAPEYCLNSSCTLSICLYLPLWTIRLYLKMIFPPKAVYQFRLFRWYRSLDLHKTEDTFIFVRD